ncbi:MAG: chromosome segregation protein SMC [Chlorobi bacterium]|nr:chromosome segregation protein SMC [Chlorobiota bacterium]
MYLSKLEIFGFKTFPNKTQINFTKGITGIVGPNGCGKTNIVDAIRWCLGEQKTSMLRSDKMEDVIFNGTNDKKPMGMAEVTLTIVNDDNTLPSEYTEVTITRRIFRSGESEYLLNKNICRLKDITNLFMDTGMGANAYSVIELKMISTIINNKADELRKMFEEAAGVNKYKLRRRLTLKKLDDVKSDLTRVNDIVSEVERSVRSLERQAKRVDKYNRLQTVLREKELGLAEREFTVSSRKIKENRSKKEELKIEKDSIDENIRSTERELIAYRTKTTEIEKELQQKRSEIGRHSEKMHQLSNSISINKERLKSSEANLIRFRKEVEEFMRQADDTEAVVQRSLTKKEELTIQLEVKEEELEDKNEVVSSTKSIVEANRQALKDLSDESISIQKDFNEKETKLDSMLERAGRNNERIELLNKKIQNLTNDTAKTVGFLEELENEKEEIILKIEESESLYAKRQKEKDDLTNKLNELHSKEIEEKSAIQGLKDKIDFIQTLINNLEGVSGGSKHLLESDGWTEKEKTIIADVGTTEDQYRYALEAALKNVLNNLLIESYDDLLSALDYLSKNDLGKAAFFLLEENGKKKGVISKLNNFALKRSSKKIEKENGFIAWANTLVATEGKWKSYFDKILSRTIVVENIETALAFRNSFPEFTIVTLHGDLIQPDGTIEAVSSHTNSEETIFGRKKLLEQLKNELPQLEQNVFNLTKEIEETERLISEIDLKVLSEKGKLLVNDLGNVEKQIAQLEFEKEKYSEEIDKFQYEIQALAAESTSVANEVENVRSELNIISGKRDESSARLAAAEEEAKALEEDYNKSLGEYNLLKVQIERLRGQIQNLANEIERGRKNKIKIENDIAARKQDLLSTEEKIGELKEIFAKLDVEREELSGIHQRLSDEKREISLQLESIKSEASRYESDLNLLRNRRETVSDEIHKVDIALSEASLRLENLVEHIREEYTIELQEKEFDDLETYDFRSESAEVHDLKQKVKNLGPVNLLAYSEYEEEKERLDFLHLQRNDLIESQKDLISTIEDINETAQKLFLDTFEQIRINFIKTFRKLFNEGDEADLFLEEGADPLEAKIEIIAKPKGKRPASIDLISQGEKTLTATALLFAIYLVKPSPFCILDEVDAPLDDANVGRFTNLIKDFSVNTQFIMITHNKKTMDAAENMYGVTMQQEGISKLAAVQFNEQLPV